MQWGIDPGSENVWTQHFFYSKLFDPKSFLTQNFVIDPKILFDSGLYRVVPQLKRIEIKYSASGLIIGRV